MTPDPILESLGPCPRILFVTATRIGDAVLSTGLLRALAEHAPEARFTIVAGPAAAPLFAAVPGLDRVIALDKRSFARHWLTLYAQVIGRRWDLVVDLRGSALAWLLSARHRVTIAKGAPDEHRVAQLGHVLGLDPPPAPLLWVDPAHERAAERLLPAGPPILAVAPAANWGAKQWPGERFAELLRRLTGAGGAFAGDRVALFAAPHERADVARVIQGLPGIATLDLSGAGDLLTVAASIRRCALFIGNDSGLMHIAAALGVPTLGLFGPSPDRRYGPWGAHTLVVRTSLSYEALVRAPDFDHRKTDSLMTTLSVDAVEAAVLDLARRHRLLAA